MWSIQIWAIQRGWLSGAGLAAENITAGLNSNDPPLNDPYRSPPERIVLSQGTPQIAFLDALDLSTRQLPFDSLQARGRVRACYLVVTFNRPRPALIPGQPQVPPLCAFS